MNEYNFTDCLILSESSFEEDDSGNESCSSKPSKVIKKTPEKPMEDWENSKRESPRRQSPSPSRHQSPSPSRHQSPRYNSPRHGLRHHRPPSPRHHSPRHLRPPSPRHHRPPSPRHGPKHLTGVMIMTEPTDTTIQSAPLSPDNPPGTRDTRAGAVLCTHCTVGLWEA